MKRGKGQCLSGPQLDAAPGLAPQAAAFAEPPPFMTLAEAAHFLHLSPDTIDRLVRTNSIPFIDLTDLGQHRPGARFKKLIRFSRTSLTQWMFDRERPVAGAVSDSTGAAVAPPSGRAHALHEFVERRKSPRVQAETRTASRWPGRPDTEEPR